VGYANVSVRRILKARVIYYLYLYIEFRSLLLFHVLTYWMQ